MHPEDKVFVVDARPDNFKTTSQGDVIPFDVIVTEVMGELLGLLL